MICSCQASCIHPLDNSAIYLHGEKFSPEQCQECLCVNGHFKCSRQNNCPALHCPEHLQVLEEGQCCKICQGKGQSKNLFLETPPITRPPRYNGASKNTLFFSTEDFCGRHGSANCHADADCRNGLFNYTCQCKEGFFGNGFNCQGN